MSKDLEIIKQLEERIGKKIQKLERINYEFVGYIQNKQNQITGLSLYECELKNLPPKIVKLQNLTKLDLRVYNQVSGNETNTTKNLDY